MIRALERIASKTEFENTRSVLAYLAREKWRDSYKANLCDYYKHYCDFYGIVFSKPRFSRVNKIIRVPTVEKINLILGHASKKYVIIYRIAMEYGLRPVEIDNLALNDIDFEKGLLTVNSAKHGNPRVLKLKDETHALLTEYVKQRQFSLNDRIFPSGAVISNTYERLKSSVAKKLNDADVKKIRL